MLCGRETKVFLAKECVVRELADGYAFARRPHENDYFDLDYYLWHYVRRGDLFETAFPRLPRFH